MKKILSVALVLFLCACTPFQSKQTYYNMTSIIELISQPDKFDGELISIKGVIGTEFENNRIYLDFESFDYSILLHSIDIIWNEQKTQWISFDGNIANPEYFNRKYVTINGRFHKNQQNPLRLSIGIIEEISKIYEVRNEYYKKNGKEKN